MTQNPPSNSNSYPSRDAIEQRAREIWEQRGRPDGQELDHWYQAEKELLEMRNQAEQRGAANAPATPPATTAAISKPAPAAPKAAVPPASAPKRAAPAQPAAAAPKVGPKKSAGPLPPKKK
jgi:hypothetical protein